MSTEKELKRGSNVSKLRTRLCELVMSLEGEDNLRSQSELCNDVKERKCHDEWA